MRTEELNATRRLIIGIYQHMQDGETALDIAKDENKHDMIKLVTDSMADDREAALREARAKWLFRQSLEEIDRNSYVSQVLGEGERILERRCCMLCVCPENEGGREAREGGQGREWKPCVWEGE